MIALYNYNPENTYDVFYGSFDSEQAIVEAMHMNRSEWYEKHDARATIRELPMGWKGNMTKVVGYVVDGHDFIPAFVLSEYTHGKIINPSWRKY